MTIPIIVGCLIILLLTFIVIEINIKRWPKGRKISIIIVGVVAVVISIAGLVETIIDVTDLSTSQISRSGAASTIIMDSSPFRFWIYIILKFIAGGAILWAGLNVIKIGINKQ